MNRFDPISPPEHTPPPGPGPDWPSPVEIRNEAGASPFVLICEHAANHMPAEYDRLGVTPDDMVRHIAWDIGAAAVTRGLSDALGAPAFLGTYSRLLVDLNRPLTSRTSMPVRSEATDIPGNAALGADERERRRRLVFDPFHDRITAHLDRRQAEGATTLIVTIHSFTPVFLGVARPWHAGILFDRSRGFAEAMIAALAADGTLTVAANQPYVIERTDDYSVPVHGTDRGLPAVLVEIRNDLITEAAGLSEWIDRLATVLSGPAGLAEQAAAAVLIKK